MGSGVSRETKTQSIKMSSQSGPCSHCLSHTTHTLKKAKQGKRSIFECAACGKRTLPCKTAGCTAFTKGGAIDRDECELHRGKIDSWPMNEDQRAAQRQQLADAAEKRARENATRGAPGAANRQPAKQQPQGNQAKPNNDLLDPSRWN